MTGESETSIPAEVIASYAERRGGGLSHTDSRAQVASIVLRNGIAVLGEDLARRALPELRLPGGSFLRSPRYGRTQSAGEPLTGEKLLRLRYAPTIGAIAIGFNWAENNPLFQLFCASLYRRIISAYKGSLSNRQKKEELSQLESELDDKIGVFINDRGIEVGVEMMTQLGKLFTGDLRRSLREGVQQAFHAKDPNHALDLLRGTN